MDPMNSPGFEARPEREEAPSDDALRAAWEEVDRQWEDDRAHARFIELARVLTRLPEASAHYRRERDRPGRSADAERRLQQIVTVALASLVPTPADEHARPRRVVVAIGYVVALVLIAVAVTFLVRAR